MELSAQIKKYRTNMNLSQEELAEKIYVTRQTISNWETGKNYPDIHSLLLLSSLFHVSLDQLIKGDLKIMKEEIKKEEIEKLHHYGTIYTILFAIMLLSLIPLILWMNVYSIAWAVIVYGIAMYFAVKIERIKKTNNIHTYKEIVAFSEGKMLDEIENLQETAKRPYQKILLALGSAALVLLLCLLIGLMKKFFF